MGLEDAEGGIGCEAYSWGSYRLELLRRADLALACGMFSAQARKKSIILGIASLDEPATCSFNNNNNSSARSFHSLLSSPNQSPAHR